MLTSRIAVIFLSIAVMWMSPRAADGQSVKIATSGESRADETLATAAFEESNDLMPVPETDLHVKEVIALALKAASQIPADSDQQEIARLAIALLQARTGDVTGASSTLASIEQLEKLGPETHNNLEALLVALAHDDNKATQIASHLKNDNSRDMIAAVISFGQASRRAFPAAVVTANSIKSSSEKSAVLKKIAVFQAITGDIQGALRLSSTIPDPGQQSDAYFSIVAEQVKRNDLHGAIQTASNVRGVELAGALSAIASAQARTGNIVSAIQTAEIALRQQPPSEGEITWAVVIKSICEAQSEVGDVKGALETASRLDNLTWPLDEYKAQALVAIAAARAKKGDTAAAPYPLEGARKAVAANFNETPNWRRALPDFDKFPVITSMLVELAKVAIAQGNPALALHVVTIVPNGQDRLLILRAIAEAEAKSGDVQKAMQASSSTQEPSGRSIIFEYTAMGQAESGDINGALRTASQIPDVGVRSEATFYLMIVRANAMDVSGVIALSAKQVSPYVATAGYVALARYLMYQGTRKTRNDATISITKSLQVPTP